MNIHEIILEDKRIDEKPTSSIGNFAKKVASKVTTGGTSARLGGSAEMGKRSNEIYKDLARWQGINSKNDKNMTAQDLAAFMKQHKLSAGGIDLPDGILPKKVIDAFEELFQTWEPREKYSFLKDTDYEKRVLPHKLVY